MWRVFYKVLLASVFISRKIFFPLLNGDREFKKKRWKWYILTDVILFLQIVKVVTAVPELDFEIVGWQQK